MPLELLAERKTEGLFLNSVDIIGLLQSSIETYTKQLCIVLFLFFFFFFLWG